MTDKPKTRAQLEAIIEALRVQDKDRLEVNGRLREQLAASEQREKETRRQFDDLKQKLAHSESESQRMRGYISRVQEDDTVREELVRTGDPEGECQLVPKRKPTAFHATDGYMAPMTNEMSVGSYHDRERRPRKHWVNY